MWEDNEMDGLCGETYRDEFGKTNEASDTWLTYVPNCKLA